MQVFFFTGGWRGLHLRFVVSSHLQSAQVQIDPISTETGQALVILVAYMAGFLALSALLLRRRNVT